MAMETRKTIRRPSYTNTQVQSVRICPWWSKAHRGQAIRGPEA